MISEVATKHQCYRQAKHASHARGYYLPCYFREKMPNCSKPIMFEN